MPIIVHKLCDCFLSTTQRIRHNSKSWLTWRKNQFSSFTRSDLLKLQNILTHLHVGQVYRLSVNHAASHQWQHAQSIGAESEHSIDRHSHKRLMHNFSVRRYFTYRRKFGHIECRKIRLYSKSISKFNATGELLKSKLIGLQNKCIYAECVWST